MRRGEQMTLSLSDSENGKGPEFQSSSTDTLPVWYSAVIGHQLSLQHPSATPVDLLFKEIYWLGLSPACDLLLGLQGSWGH